MQAFFSAAPDVPNGVGFVPFGWFHLGWLLAVAALCGVFLRYGTGWSAQRSVCVRKIATAAMAGSEIVRLVILALGGSLNRGVLPLHLCSMAVWLCLLHAWRGWDWTGQTLYGLCLPGACAALLFPDWTGYPPQNYFCLHSFAIHGATVVYIVTQGAVGAIVPRRAAWYKPLLFLGAVLPPVYVLDRVWNVNYCFLLRPSHGSPLELLGRLGTGWYLPAYLAGMAALIALMLAAGQWWSERKREKKPKKNPEIS